VDLTEAEEALILATFDPIAAMAATDKKQLDALLRDVATGEAALQEMLAELAKKEGITPPDVDFKEYTEEVEKDVEYITCPECGHKWPK
jgi:hypothetical protein